MENKQKSLTASQRLEGLEASMGALDQALGNITMNLQTTIEAMTLLSKKVESIVRLGNSGKSINSATIAAELIAINVEELKSKVDDLKERGMAVDASEIQENSFVVGRELAAESQEVSNERIQFPLFGLKDTIKAKLVGKKVGDILALEEGRNLLEITEIYNIVVPSMNQSQAVVQAAETSSTETATSEASESTTSESEKTENGAV